MKTSTYNIVAIVLLIAGVCYLNVLSMEKQKETDHQIDITISKIKSFFTFAHYILKIYDQSY